MQRDTARGCLVPATEQYACVVCASGRQSMVTHSVWRVSTPHRIGVLVNNGTIRRAVCQISDVMTTKLCGAHICPPSAVMPSQSMGASHACQQHIRRHAASQHRHVFRRQLSRPYVHRLSWCERSQRRVSSKQVRSKATQNSVFARTPVGFQCRCCKPLVYNMPAYPDGHTSQVRVKDMCQRDQSVLCFWQVAAANE